MDFRSIAPGFVALGFDARELDLERLDAGAQCTQICIRGHDSFVDRAPDDAT
jgi:hypothetical protein